MEVQSGPLPRDDILVRSDGLVVKNKEAKMSDTLDVLTRMSDDLENSYRSVSSVTDFSKVVVGMMDSLKDLELKGDDMVKKIGVQESRLKSLKQEIEAKEEYITVVNEKVKESEAVFSDLKEKIKIVEERNRITQEDTERNENKIKAQEVRLKRLVKDITTKVEYVNVVDDKISQMEEKFDVTSRELDSMKKGKKNLEATVKDFESRAKFAEEQIEKFNREMVEKEKLHRNTISQHKTDIIRYSSELSRSYLTLISWWLGLLICPVITLQYFTNNIKRYYFSLENCNFYYFLTSLSHSASGCYLKQLHSQRETF